MTLTLIGDKVVQNGKKFHMPVHQFIYPKECEVQLNWSEGQIEESEGQLEESEDQL